MALACCFRVLSDADEVRQGRDGIGVGDALG